MGILTPILINGANGRKYGKGDINAIPWKNITGYDKNKEGEVIIVENEVVIIRQIFDEFLHGKGTKEIARDLNRKLETETYSAGHIFITLQNEKYKGDVRFSLTINQNPLTKKPIKNVGQAPQYYVKHSHPAIVTEELWELANQELARQRQFCSDPVVVKIVGSFN